MSEQQIMKEAYFPDTLQNELEHELKLRRNVRVYRRAAALLAVKKGKSVNEVAACLGVARQSVYNWVATYGQGGRGGDLADAPRSGRPRRWTEQLSIFLAETLRQSPAALGYSKSHWTARLLQAHLAARRSEVVSDETMRRELRRLGYVWERDRYALRSALHEEANSQTVSELASYASLKPVEAVAA